MRKLLAFLAFAAVLLPVRASAEIYSYTSQLTLKVHTSAQVVLSLSGKTNQIEWDTQRGLCSSRQIAWAKNLGWSLDPKGQYIWKFAIHGQYPAHCDMYFKGNDGSSLRISIFVER